MPEARERVLVADDEPAILEVCLRVLQRRGYEVTGVSNGRRALAQFASGSYDLVLTDIKMPDLDGLELLRKVKESHPDTPVVLITGYGNLETAMQAVRLGAGGFLLKPFHASELLHAVEEALDKTRLWRENVRFKTLIPLLEVSRSLMGQTDPGSLGQLIVRLAADTLSADQAWLLLRGDGPELAQAAYAGPDQPPIEPEILARLAGRESGEDAELSSPTVEDLIRDALGLSDVYVLGLGSNDQGGGYLVFGRANGREPFEEGDREALSIFAGQAATALENANLFQQTRDYAENLEEMVEERTRELGESEAQVRQLYETSRQLHISLDLDLIVANILGLATAASAARLGHLVTIEPAGELYHSVQQGNLWDPEAAEAALSAYILQQASLSRQSVAIGDVTEDEGSGSGATGSALALPMEQDNVLHAILILRHPEPGRFTTEHIDLLTPICMRAAALIANARIFRQTSERLARAYEELGERAKQLEMTTQQLVRADRLAVIGQLAAGISHEMGNIIAPLQVYADLLENAQPGAADHSTYVEQIQRITDRARTILRQFTDFARKDSFKAVAVDVRTILDQGMVLIKYSLTRKGIMVTIHVPSEPLLVNIDPGQLEQVFVNIIVNAIDAMPGGGSLRVSIVGHESPSESALRGYVEIRFQDTGIGIEPENLAHAFEPFFTTKEVGKGTGLGLFICYGIIERHNGSIDIESQPGIGTTIIIRLPYSDDALPDGNGLEESKEAVGNG